jgi:hypothetical protein
MTSLSAEKPHDMIIGRAKGGQISCTDSEFFNGIGRLLPDGPEVPDPLQTVATVRFHVGREACNRVLYWPCGMALLICVDEKCHATLSANIGPGEN